jgi:Holliday junction resolvasome RuvABC ATP-dependent DNA helicase subunit
MTKFKIFNETNNVYPGINEPQFSQLEQLAELANIHKIQLPHIGIFGEASTGKTTSTKLLANACNYLFLSYNAMDFSSLEEFHKILFTKFKDLNSGEYALNNGNFGIPTKKTVILIDEAQELKTSIQSALLSILTKKEGVFSEILQYTFLIDNITWIFATTDPSKLVYPLTTRLVPITFNQYTLEDIEHIISMKYPLISDGGLEIMAKCAKLVPRAAVRNAEFLVANNVGEVISEEKTEEFVKTFLGCEKNGVDGIDKRILMYLSNYQKQIKPIDKISLAGFTNIKEHLETKGIKSLSLYEHKEYNRAKFQILMLTEKINNAPPIPKSRRDISLACRLLDLKDLEMRLTYLESLKFIEKTPKGICISENYRTNN